MRFWFKIGVVLVCWISGLALGAGDFFEALHQDINAYSQAKTRPSTYAVNYQIVNGKATRSHGFNSDGELWIESGNEVTRLFAASGAIVVYTDGSTARYSDVQKSLRDWVNAHGPLNIQVHKFAGGASFAQIRILAPR